MIEILKQNILLYLNVIKLLKAIESLKKISVQLDSNSLL